MTLSIMLQGTASDVGKSVLTAGLCRIFRQDGLRVAPFKSQNMALNSGITASGEEMGRAQIFQAEAAGIAPDVRMNPILLKPTSDCRAQVVLMGKALSDMEAQSYHQSKPRLMEIVERAYRSLADEFDAIVIEGAGSPAEINLREGDLVNMGLAERVDAPVILVADIDRGGVFAAIYGTLALLSEEERARIKGVIINKFRGDIALLAPGVDAIEKLTGVPVLGVMPFMTLSLEDEDSVGVSQNKYRQLWRAKGEELDVAVIHLPYMSNFTDFNALAALPDVLLRYVARGEAIGYPDLLIIPGSKNTIGDLNYLHDSGLADEVRRLSTLGVPIVGICGGYQMLGRRVFDGVESGIEECEGLGLLPIETRFFPQKTTAQVSATIDSPKGTGIFSSLGEIPITGYEIHMGQTVGCAPLSSFCRLNARNGAAVSETDGAINAEGNVMGSYLHGLFDEGPFARTLLNRLRLRKGLAPLAQDSGFSAFKEQEYERLACQMRVSIDIERIYRIMRQNAAVERL